MDDPRFPPVRMLRKGLTQHPQNPVGAEKGSRLQRTRRGTGIANAGPGFQMVRSDHSYAEPLEIELAIGTLSAQILTDLGALRNFLLMRNTSATANVLIAFGRDASLNSAIRLTPNQMILFDVVVPQGDMYAIADAAAASLTVSYSTIPEMP